jgi:CRP-like cAMP-binding protein
MKATENGKKANNVVSAEPGNGRAGTKSIESILRTHPFLEGMSEHQFRILSDCAMQSHFGADELIFCEGDPANRFYLIQKGKVALESHTEESGIVRVQVIGAGDVLGWSWLFPPHFWHFDARTIEPTEAIFLYGSPLREECEADHELGYELVKRMAQVIMSRLQATRRQLLKAQSAIR